MPSAPVKPAVHFIGFRGEEYWSAVRVWGLPDFYHRVWDMRAQREIAAEDTCVFAKYDPAQPSPYNFDDSNFDDDPAAKERLTMPGSFSGRTARSERAD